MSYKIGRAVAEIDGRPERAADEGGGDPDPETSECGGKEHRRDIGREEYVGADQGKKPSCRGPQSEAGYCKPDGKKRPWLGNSVPAPPKFINHLHHVPHKRPQNSKLTPT